MAEMQYQFPGVSAETKALVDACGKNIPFQPLRYTHLEERPDWWLVRAEEIIEICRSVKKGRAEIIAETPAGFPVYAVFYGDFAHEVKGMNFSAVTGCDEPERFCPKREKQVLVFLAGIHGAEPESIISALNMIVLKETGKDMLGNPRPEFTALMDQYDIIIIPSFNMDGRYLSPDHLKGCTMDDFQGACQGRWADGRSITWMESKRYFPLPLDEVSFPGGYPNSDGFNMMHDACPGHIRTAEMRAFLQLLERYAADFVLHGHSCGSPAFAIYPSDYHYTPYFERICHVADCCNKALTAAGLHPEPVYSRPERPGRCVNINNLIPLVCGGLSLTIECNSWGTDFEAMMEPNFVIMQAIMEDGLRKPFVDRARLIANDPEYLG